MRSAIAGVVAERRVAAIPPTTVDTISAPSPKANAYRGVAIATKTVSSPEITSAVPNTLCAERQSRGSSSVRFVRNPATQFGRKRGMTLPITTSATPNEIPRIRVATAAWFSAAVSTALCRPTITSTTPDTMVSYVLPKRSNCSAAVTSGGADRNRLRPTR